MSDRTFNALAWIVTILLAIWAAGIVAIAVWGRP